ncbi:endophilin-B2 isoform X1 [Cyrtonyx montezumae]|uniref:endophilin-B2 isoform X1 n=1 Tax=Cyrtonyx montezumae TaxID=9017 RepID=UPI0032DAD1B2
MDFNVKKLASDAGVFFSRAMQFTEEKLGQAEKTELDAHFENLLARADSTKNWTEKILRQTEVLLQPNPSARVEEFLYEKLDRKVPSRVTNGELLAQYMTEAANDFGPGTPYGKTLIKVGETQRRLGAAERDFIHSASINFLTPLRNFLEGDWRTISKERRILQNRRLDLDACKARLKKAKAAEAKAAAVPDFQETRPRNYVLSASASAVRLFPHRCCPSNLFLPLSPPDLISDLVLCCFQHFNVTWDAWSSSDSTVRMQVTLLGARFQDLARLLLGLLSTFSPGLLPHLKWEPSDSVSIASGATERKIPSKVSLSGWSQPYKDNALVAWRLSGQSRKAKVKESATYGASNLAGRQYRLVCSSNTHQFFLLSTYCLSSWCSCGWLYTRHMLGWMCGLTHLYCVALSGCGQAVDFLCCVYGSPLHNVTFLVKMLKTYHLAS